MQHGGAEELHDARWNAAVLQTLEMVLCMMPFSNEDVDEVRVSNFEFNNPPQFTKLV